MITITRAILDDLQEKALAATGGTWKVEDSKSTHPEHGTRVNAWHVRPDANVFAGFVADCRTGREMTVGHCRKNAEFIALANPEMILTLVEFIKGLFTAAVEDQERRRESWFGGTVQSDPLQRIADALELMARKAPWAGSAGGTAGGAGTPSPFAGT